MKKTILLCLTIALVILLSSCSLMLPVTRLETMFGSNPDASVSSGAYSSGSTGTDSVTISREEYEKYRRFSDMYTIMDAAKEGFYQEVEDDKLIEYATRGLMAGLGDPYSFY